MGKIVGSSVSENVTNFDNSRAVFKNRKIFSLRYDA